MSGCKIGKITFKNGTTLQVFPHERKNINRVDLGWGEVTFRSFDDKKLTIADMYYMADAAKHLIMTEEG